MSSRTRRPQRRRWHRPAGPAAPGAGSSHRHDRALRAGLLLDRRASALLEAEDGAVRHVGVGVLLYMAGQAISTLKWRILLGPVGLSTPYLRLLGFYFTGMFFNLFLPTIIGGDAVKAVLLARETGAPARATMSVFMERKSGCVALLLIALVAILRAPPSTSTACRCRRSPGCSAAGYVAANIVLFCRRCTGSPIDRSRARRWGGCAHRAGVALRGGAAVPRARGLVIAGAVLCRSSSRSSSSPWYS